MESDVQQNTDEITQPNKLKNLELLDKLNLSLTWILTDVLMDVEKSFQMTKFVKFLQNKLKSFLAMSVRLGAAIQLKDAIPCIHYIIPCIHSHIYASPSIF